MRSFMAIASAHSLVWNVAPMRVSAYYHTFAVRKLTAVARRRIQFTSFSSFDSGSGSGIDSGSGVDSDSDSNSGTPSSEQCRSSTDAIFQPLNTAATVSQLTMEAIAWLQERNVPEPEASVYQLLASALNLDWADGYRSLQQQQQQQRDDPTSLQHRLVSSEELMLLQTMLDRRATMEPIQYILGQWDFLDYTLQVRAPLLCPRPETEELVLHVERDFRDKYFSEVAMDEENEKDEGPQKHRILDIGCGTGAIGISLCHRLGGNVNVDAIDIDPIAVQVSNLNAQRILGVNQASFRTEQCDIANFVSSGYSMVVSNPPYIPRCDMATLEENVVNFEHDSGLCGGEDGLDVVREIIRKLPSLCLSGASCWMEVDPSHPAMIKELLRDNDVVDYQGSYKDIFGNDRFVKLMVS